MEEKSRIRSTLDKARTALEIAGVVSAIRGPALPPPLAPLPPPQRDVVASRQVERHDEIRDFAIERDIDHLAEVQQQQHERWREQEPLRKPEYSEHRPPPEPRRKR